METDQADNRSAECTGNERRARRIPLWVKGLYTAFLAVLIPTYLYSYGPTNFLYFCDLALLMMLVAVWTESPLWTSMPAVGILLPQSLWCADFLGTCVGLPITATTAYMFESQRSPFTRGLSFFHFWLPFFVVWAVWRLGYDRRALICWSILACCLLLVCYSFMPAPPAPAGNPGLPVNINYVYGPSDAAPQHWMPPLAWLGLLLVGMPLLIYFPTHLLLSNVFRTPPASR